MEENRETSNPTVLYIKAIKDGNTPIVNPGSGFFVENDLIVTNIHVVAGATSVYAELIDPKTNSIIEKFDVESVRAVDGKNDLIILKTVSEAIPSLIGESDQVQCADPIQVIGCPNRKYKATKGTIHSIRNSDKWLRMTVKTIKGSSGGPVLNCKGKIIGIHTRASDFYCYAIPSRVLSDLINQPKLTKPLNLEKWCEEKVSSAYFHYIQAQEAKSVEKKITSLDKAIKLYPDYIEFYSKRGAAKLSLGQSKDVVEAQRYYKEAIDDYAEILQADGESAETYTNRGIAKCLLGKSKIAEKNMVEAQQYYTEAIKDHTDAIKLCLNYLPAYENRGIMWGCFGRLYTDMNSLVEALPCYQNAVDDYTQVIELCSCYAPVYKNRAEAWCVIGNLQDKAGMVEVARSSYQAAIDDCNNAVIQDQNLAVDYELNYTRSKAEDALK